MCSVQTVPVQEHLSILTWQKNWTDDMKTAIKIKTLNGENTQKSEAINELKV